MKSIQFLGAAGGVTGSGYLVTADDGDQLLVDLGMFQGSVEEERLNAIPLEVDVSKLRAVVLTHAHLDHCGRLPLLVKAGYQGKIFMTEPTLKIMHVTLTDSAKIAHEENPDHALYTTEDVEMLMTLTEIVDYGQVVVSGQFTITLRDAGHILGSASVEIGDVNDVSQVIAFSGDLGNSPQDLIQPTENIKKASTVVMESTYGDSLHPDEDITEILKAEINAIEDSDGVLLIPAFSVERTQELIHRIGHLKSEGLIRNDTPVYLDSPMGIEVTQIFKKYPKLYNRELRHDIHPFDFAGLVYTRSGKESKQILDVDSAKIVIAGSGMMSGGRITHHLKNYLGRPSTRLLIVGYQAEGTLGREIENRPESVMIDGEKIIIHATITKLESLSSHADQAQLLIWLKAIAGVRKVFLVHGEDEQRATLARKITEELGIVDVIVPEINQVFSVE